MTRCIGCPRWASALAIAAMATSIATSAEAAPYFQEVPSAFGTQPCSPAGCWTNYLRVTDIDGDGDLDVLMPNADGYFSKNGTDPQPFAVYLNDGNGAFTDGSAKTVGGYSGYLRQVAVGDVDGDGDLDMYAPDAWGAPDKYFVNAGGGVFEDKLASLNPGVASHAGAARFGDVDNDGDLDLFVGDGWAQGSPVVAHLYLNDGAGKMTDATAQLPTTKEGQNPIDFDLFDADGDFDLDLLVNMHEDKNSLWLNDGTGKFTDATPTFPPPGGGSMYHYGPQPCDVDGDGDLDVWIDNTGGGYNEQLLINNGSAGFTDETSARVTGNVGGADDNGVACIDVDGDGDLDAAIMSLTSNERVLLNDGTGHFTKTATPAFSTANDGTLWFDFGDLNGDGKLDCVTGQGESSFADRVYMGTDMAPVDTRAPAFRAVEQVGVVADGATALVHFGVVDNATTDEGPRLQKAFVRVTAGASPVDVPAVFMGGDLYRAELPGQANGVMVSYEACAIDRQGNEGCAEAKSYTVGSTSTTSVGGAGPSAGGAGGDSGPGGPGAGTGGNAGEDPLVPSDSGCGCAVPGHSSSEKIALLLIAMGSLAARRRRRR